MLTVVVLIGGLFALSVKTTDLPQTVIKERNFKFKFDDLFERKALPLAALACLIAFAYASVLSFLSLYADQKHLLEAASYFYVVFAVAMIGIRPFTGKVYDTIGPKFVIIPSFLLFALGLVMLAFANGTWLFLASAIFIGAGYGTLTTSFQSLCVQAASANRSGYATATYFTLFDTGIALGSYVLGIIAVKMSYESVYELSALLLVVVFALYIVFFARKQPKQA